MKINWYGNIGQGQGYSGSSEKMVVALEKCKNIDVRVVSFADDKTPKQNLTKEGSNVKLKTFELADVGICYGFPNAFTSMMNNKFKVGFTMFETDKLPNGRNTWAGKTGNSVDIINKMNLLLVPSKHNKELFEKEGVTIPIEVVRLGIDPQDYVIMDRPHRDTFTFYMCGVLTIRKNPGLALSCFLDLFKDNPNVKIVFKTNSGTMGHMTFPYTNVKIIDRMATNEEMFSLMKDADCFIFPSRGEGFGLTPLEAMATGLPTIFANNTGMMEYANPDFNYPIECDKIAPAQRFPKEWGDVGNWYEVNYHKFRDAMLEVYNNRDASKLKGMASAYWVRDNWNFDKTAESILKAIDKYYKK